LAATADGRLVTQAAAAATADERGKKRGAVPKAEEGEVTDDAEGG
jgi:hypothetical protein